MRNKFTIEGTFPSHPADGLYKFSVYLQVWRSVARRKDLEAVELTISKIHALHTAIQDPRE
jgi:hypothetical protein